MSPQQIAHYRITAKLGEGGMGEVYRATDTKLGREVALKIIPEAFAQDAGRMARFTREAQVLASLNHPNIAAIYGVEERALVMELVEGETLAGPLPVETALDYARQMAAALEYAHERGVVHRDLKPANVMVTHDGVVKVLDFGLAKAVEEERTGNPETSPTLTMRETQLGVILGTAAYMAPEQARGKTVDKRADIWAFGVVLWEMLTGKRLFEGETVSDTLAQVLTKEPDWNAIPVSLRPVLKRCIERDAKRRLRDAGDVRLLLDESGTAAQPAAAPLIAPQQRVWPAVAAVLLVALGVLSFLYFRQRPVEMPFFEYTVAPPEDSVIHSFAVSSDGRSLAMAVTAGGKRSLWLRTLDSLQARALPGTDDATFPFWSPDGRFIGFSAQGKVKKIAVGGGPAQIVSDASGSFSGSWSRDGIILFGSPVKRVPASGGVPDNVSRSRYINEFPVFLPDGRHFLYSVPLAPEDPGVFSGSLDSSDVRRLLPDVSNSAYAPPRDGRPNGHVFFVRDGTLMAQPVNPQSFQPDGEPVPVAEQMASGAQIGFQQFSASENGVLIYQAGQSTDLPQLTWFARSGKELGSVGAPSRIFDFALSPDDKQVAIARADVQLKTSDLWIRDLERGTETRFTSHASINERPVWSADGARIVFSSTRAGRTDLYQKLATGTAQDESVLAGLTAKFAMDLSRDGKLLLYEEGVRSIFVLPLDGGRNPRAVFHSEFRETQPQLSPDGRWLAYVSDESGRNEIYVRPFSMDANAPGGKWPVSNGGGADPRWRRDGQELFFLAADGKLMAAKVKGGAGAGFSTDVPESLFEVPPFFSRVANGSFRYAVTGDGNRFLVLMGPKNAVQPPLTVVTNWESAVKR